MSNIRPIETYYDGHLFRSRLEARWAVFFNAMGVPYEYEPEGFELGNGMRYLPDFRVKCYGKRGDHSGPPFDLYIEVKGKMTEEDAKKINAFVNLQVVREDWGEWEQPENHLLIVHMIPNEGCATDVAMSFYDLGSGLYPFNYYTIDGDDFGAYPAATKDGKFYLFGADSSYINPEDEIRVENAYREARCARFEHGEKPPSRF